VAWHGRAMGELDWPFLGAEALACKAIPERAMRSLYEAATRVSTSRGVSS
jgi:hypothetical protein